MDKETKQNDLPEGFAGSRKVLGTANLTLQNRNGLSRLYYSSQVMAAAGFVPGSRASMKYDPEVRTLVLKEDPSGQKQISRKKKRRQEEYLPVVDINSADLDKVFGRAVERVKIVVAPGVMEISIPRADVAAVERNERLLDKLKAGTPLDIGSYSHGVGILDHAIHEGLRSAGVSSRLAFAVEREERYLEASIEANPLWNDGGQVFLGDMRDIDPRDLPTTDIFIAGLPCDAATQANTYYTRPEDHPELGALFIYWLDGLKHSNPAVAIWENVPQMGAAATTALVKNVLTYMGYDVHETILSAKEQGSLENRKRQCLVAVSKQVKGVNLGAVKSVLPGLMRLKDALEDVPLDANCWKPRTYLVEKEIADKAKSKNRFPRQILDGSETSVPVLRSGYYKGGSTDPVLQHPDKPELTRLLSGKEHGAIKRIPESFMEGIDRAFGGAQTGIHEVLGNSVDHGTWKALGKHLGEVLNAHAGLSTIESHVLNEDKESPLEQHDVPEKANKQLGLFV